MFQMYGVVPPMITPFRETGEVDFEGLHTLVDYLSGQVDGLFINGSYGAGVMMTEEERRAVTEKTIETAAGRVPVVAHIGTADSYSAARLAKHAAEVGAAAVASVGPFYFKHNPDQICEYYRRIVEAVDGRVPVYVYNNVSFQGYTMSGSTFEQLKAIMSFLARRSQ